MIHKLINNLHVNKVFTREEFNITSRGLVCRNKENG